MNRGITKENMLFTLPLALRGDISTEALATATAEKLADRLAELDRLRIISNIDNLEEALLAILARDFKVDWYDPDYSLEEKRRTVKSSWRVHKTLGTKAAVETAIRAIYPLTTVEEWFEYGGEPYHFRLNIDITSDSGDRARQKRVLERLNFYKSLRSHNDGVRYFLVPEKSWAVAGGLFAGSREIDRATIQVPELAKPGGKTVVLAGGGLTGTRSVGRAEVKVPALIRPGGRTAVVAGGAFAGSRSADRATVRVPPLKRPGAVAGLTAGGAFAGYRQRVNGAVDVPPLTRPQGAADRAVSTGCIGSIERATVKLDTRRVKVPTGRAATAGAAGVFHSYQQFQGGKNLWHTGKTLPLQTRAWKCSTSGWRAGKSASWPRSAAPGRWIRSC